MDNGGYTRLEAAALDLEKAINEGAVGVEFRGGYAFRTKAGPLVWGPQLGWILDGISTPPKPAP